jgi:MerR family mercuric resistance operon transcriptional regulator
MNARVESKPLRIAAAAKEAGVNVQTLHYYERRGLLSPARAGSGGYRAYGASDVARVRAVKRAQALGFSLAEIDELLGIGSRDRKQVKRLAATKLVELDEKIRDLTAIRASLGDLMETCRCGGDLASCRIFDGLGEP